MKLTELESIADDVVAKIENELRQSPLKARFQIEDYFHHDITTISAMCNVRVPIERVPEFLKEQCVTEKVNQIFRLFAPRTIRAMELKCSRLKRDVFTSIQREMRLAERAQNLEDKVACLQDEITAHKAMLAEAARIVRGKVVLCADDLEDLKCDLFGRVALENGGLVIKRGIE